MDQIVYVGAGIGLDSFENLWLIIYNLEQVSLCEVLSWINSLPAGNCYRLFEFF